MCFLRIATPAKDRLNAQFLSYYLDQYLVLIVEIEALLAQFDDLF